MRYLIIGLSGLVLAACATTSQSDDGAADMQAAAPAPTRVVSQGDAGDIDGSDVVCRAERVTGQLRRERICRTVAEWQAIREAGRDTIANRQATGNQWGSGTQSDTNPH